MLDMPDTIPHIKEKGVEILFCSDGSFNEFVVEDIIECGADGLIFEPLSDLRMIVKKIWPD